MRAVKQAHPTPFTSTGYFVALMLVLFSTSGLLAGVLTRQVASALRTTSGNTSTLPPAALTATADAGAPTSPGAFTLRVAVAPSVAKAGQTIQIAVTAVGKGVTTPTAGVQCTLVPTSDSLALSPWPDPVSTDSTGHAAWTITVPVTTTPGQYGLSVRGDGPSGYHYTWRQTLTVSA